MGRGRLSITKIKVKTLRVGNNAPDTPDIPDVPDTPETPTVPKHTVTFNANGGTSDVQTIEVDDNSTLETIPSSSRTGYTFLGWFDEMEGGNKLVANTRITSDITYYAHWNINQYTITYNMNGHGSPNPLNLQTYTVETGEYTPEPLEDVEGWRFEGWTPTSIPEGSIEDVIFTANWFDMAKLTRVKYTSESGLSDWEGVITGIIEDNNDPQQKVRIPNKEYIETIDIGNSVTHIGI